MLGRTQAANKACSNCVINLSPDKAKVFRQAYRVLKPGGRLTVSDIVSEGELPDDVKSDSNAWACCIGGALQQQEYLKEIKKAGFKSVQVLSTKEFCIEGEGSQALTKLPSISVKAHKGA